MKYQSVLLGLASTCAAIDGYVYLDNTYCGGNWLGFKGINPNVCYSASRAGQSIGWYYVPDGWNLETRNYHYANCDEGSVDHANILGYQGSSMCVPAGPRFDRYQSLGYGFLGRKRSTAKDVGDCVKPDTFGLADGTMFNLTAMSDAQVEQLLDSADPEAAGLVDVADLFKEYIM